MDPNPIKHPAVLLARVREAIEPVLHKAGFRYECRNDPRGRRGRPHFWIDYRRGQEIVSLEFGGPPAKLSLTAVDEHGAVHEIALISFQVLHTSGEILERADQFVQCVQRSPFLVAEGPAEHRPHVASPAFNVSPAAGAGERVVRRTAKTRKRKPGRDPTAKELAEAKRVAALPKKAQRDHRSAVPSDHSKLDHINTYGCLPEFYIDKPFQCRECGKAEIWKAADQKWYCEEAKGHPDATAVRCHDCRVASSSFR